MERLKKWAVDLLIRKSCLLALLAVGLLASCNMAVEDGSVGSDILDNPATLTGKKIEKMPEITFEETEFNAGEISQGEILNYVYKFTNTGNAPLVLSSVSASCGCTVAKNYPRGKILPGEGGEIAVEFNSDNKWGELDVSITVAANTIPAVTQLLIRTNIVVPDNMKY